MLGDSRQDSRVAGAAISVDAILERGGAGRARRREDGFDGYGQLIEDDMCSIVSRQSQNVGAGGAESDSGVERRRIGEHRGSRPAGLRPRGGDRARRGRRTIFGHGAVQVGGIGRLDGLIGPSLYLQALIGGAPTGVGSCKSTLLALPPASAMNTSWSVTFCLVVVTLLRPPVINVPRDEKLI